MSWQWANVTELEVYDPVTDELIRQKYVRADLYAALEAKYDTECKAANRWQEIAVEAEAERDRLRLRLTEALMYAERGAPLRVTDILREALQEGGDGWRGD